MKKKIVEALKTNDAYKGLSDSILNRAADMLIKGGKVKEEGDIEDAIAGLNLSQVIESYADSRANEAGETAVKNYEKKHNLKDGKIVKTEGAKEKPDEKPEGEGGDELPEWAKEMRSTIDALKKENENLKNERTSSSRKSRLDEILKNAPEKVRDRFTKDYDRLTFKDDDDFNTWLEDSKTYVEDVTKDFSAGPKPPSAPKTGGGDASKTASAGARAYAQRIAKQAETATSAIQGLPTNK